MKNVFVLGFFPDKSQVLLKKLCENFSIIMFESQFAKSLSDLGVQTLEEIIELSQLQFPQAEFSWEIHQTVNQVEEQLGNLISGGKKKAALYESEFMTINKVAFSIYWRAFVFRQLLDKIDLDLLLVNADYSFTRRPMVIEAKSRGIPVLDIEHGFFAMEPEPKVLNENFLPATPYISDFVNLDNDLEKAIWDEHYESSELNGHVTFVVNGTPIDISFDNNLKKEDALTALNLCPDKFTLSLIGSWMEARIPSNLFKAQIEQVEFYKFVFQGLKNFPRKNDIQFIVKLHPAFATKQVFEDSTNYLKHLAQECGLEHVLLTCTGLSEVLSGSDMLIASHRTSVLWEAFLASVPAFIYPAESAVKYMFKEGKLNSCNILFQKGAMKYVTTAEEFKNAVDFYLQQENLKEHKALCKKLFDEFNIKPLSAKEKSEKICGWIKTFLESPGVDAAEQKEESALMNVVDIKTEHVCTGPMNYLVTWACDLCGEENVLRKRATLLLDESTNCTKCGQGHTYVYDEGNYAFEILDADIVNLENTILHNRNVSEDDEIYLLGQDLIFSVNTYISHLIK
ncbi:hypothetical protein IH879_13405 [candidate division KSB1 bacterium]|nr:hypothetical protein [candidate division KSB1 bacterium]